MYHLDLNKKMIENARIALLPGDPFRSQIIAGMISEYFDTNRKQLAWNREFCTFLSEIRGEKIVITSTGVGGPSTSIVIDELAQLGVDTFIRVGTTGAIQDFIQIGDVVITTGSVRMDGTSTHYAPIEYPAVSHHKVLNALIEGAKKKGVKFHVGITVSSDSFYPGEERKKSFSQYILRRFEGITEEWRKLHVLNIEMESSTLLTLTAAMGLKGGCVTGVINTKRANNITREDLKTGEENAIKTAIAGVECLLYTDRQEKL